MTDEKRTLADAIAQPQAETALVMLSIVRALMSQPAIDRAKFKADLLHLLDGRQELGLLTIFRELVDTNL